MTKWLAIAATALTWAAFPVTAAGQGPPQGQSRAVDMRTMPTPMDAADEVWMEEMTVIEIRDAIAAGKTTAIVLTGGVEQNGPYLPTGKHNIVLSAMGGPIARRLGTALLAPIITVEPGNIDSPSCFGCTFVSPATYRAIVSDMATALRGQGFKNIVFIGDSGGNQNTMKATADSLNARWASEAAPTAPAAQHARLHYVEPYYREDIWSCTFIKEELGVLQQPDDCAATRDLYHDDYHYTSIILTTPRGPQRIRHDQRMKAGLFNINGVDLFPLEKTLSNGWRLVEYRTDITAKAIEAAIKANPGR
jgi:creatinine amidohydrolase